MKLSIVEQLIHNPVYTGRAAPSSVLPDYISFESMCRFLLVPSPVGLWGAGEICVASILDRQTRKSVPCGTGIPKIEHPGICQIQRFCIQSDGSQQVPDVVRVVRSHFVQG